MSQIAADIVLTVHFAFVCFVVGGLVLTWIGAGLNWRWVRNPWFRATHLAAILFVMGEALLGFVCPLTTWEDALRGQKTNVGFVARWVHRVMFYELSERVFTIVYVAFALVIALTYWLLPPRRFQKKNAP